MSASFNPNPDVLYLVIKRFLKDGFSTLTLVLYTEQHVNI